MSTVAYGIIAVLVIILIVAFVIWYKQNQQKKLAEEERQRILKREAEIEEEKRLQAERLREEKKAEMEAGKEIYHYMNQSIKTMFYHYRTEQWDKLPALGTMELADQAAARRCIDKLPAASKKMVCDFLQCLELDEGYQGSGEIVKRETLKEVFEGMMLPFLPVYYKEFSNGPRYISFLNPQILKLFTQLSGKKFRLGYKNRYQNGQIAFEWSDDVYRVFAMDGKQLCEASFENGNVKDGYAILKMNDAEDESWDIYQKGVWKDGNLKKEDMQYNYKVIV